jgi:hypothetical protein
MLRWKKDDAAFLYAEQAESQSVLIILSHNRDTKI